MKNFLLIAVMFFFISGCSSGKYDAASGSSEKNGNSLTSKEILLTSLFVATTHMPEEKSLEIEFSERGSKFSISKDSKKKIADFANDIIRYEDYSVSVESFIYISSDAAKDEKLQNNAGKKRELVKKALIKNGINKDKITLLNIDIAPFGEEADRKESRKNGRIVVMSEVW